MTSILNDNIDDFDNIEISHSKLIKFNIKYKLDIPFGFKKYEYTLINHTYLEVKAKKRLFNKILNEKKLNINELVYVQKLLLELI